MILPVLAAADPGAAQVQIVMDGDEVGGFARTTPDQLQILPDR